jgi:hypothetical protein
MSGHHDTILIVSVSDEELLRFAVGYDGARAAAAWRLLNANLAPQILAILRARFTDRDTVPAKAIVALVADDIRVLNNSGRFAIRMDNTAGWYCRDWVTSGWLLSRTDATGSEAEFQLTADAAHAIFIGNQLVSPAAAMTESAVASMMTQLSYVRNATDPDFTSRVAAATVERDRWQTELDRLNAGGPDAVTVMDDRHAADTVRGALHFADRALAQFGYLVEQVEAHNRAWHRETLDADMTRGEGLARLMVYIDTLETADDWVSFAGFYSILQDPARRTELNANISALLNTPSARLLSVDERLLLRDLPRVLIDAASKVQDRRATQMKMMRTYIEDPRLAEERKIGEMIREAMAVYADVAARKSSRSRLPYELPLATVDATSMSAVGLDRTDRKTPPEVSTTTAPEPYTFAELEALADRDDINFGVLESRIADMLTDHAHPRSAVSIGELVGRNAQGFAPLLGYLILGYRRAETGGGINGYSATVYENKTDTVALNDTQDAVIPYILFYPEEP